MVGTRRDARPCGRAESFPHLPPVLIESQLPGNWLIRAVTEQSGDADTNGVLDDCER